MNIAEAGTFRLVQVPTRTLKPKLMRGCGIPRSGRPGENRLGFIMTTYFDAGRFYLGLHWTTQVVRVGDAESDIAWTDHEVVFAFLGFCCQFNWRDSK